MSVITRHPSGGFTSSRTALYNSAYDNQTTNRGSLHKDATNWHIRESERGQASEVATSVDAKPIVVDVDHGCIVVIEPRLFLREFFRRGMQSKFTPKFELFAGVDEFERYQLSATVHLIIFSCAGSSDLLETAGGRASIERLSVLLSQTPIVVLGSRQDPQHLRNVLAMGVRGYIPMSMGLDLAIEAMRFVMVGGAFVPADVFAAPASSSPTDAPTDRLAITAREMLVMKSIKQGKPNKVIAYELNMCESTVKVHVRNIMKKLNVKNRTSVAMKCDDLRF